MSTKCAELWKSVFQIRPQEMSEGCFWVLADEDQYAKPELLSRVALTFCSQRTGQTLTSIFTYIHLLSMNLFWDSLTCYYMIYVLVCFNELYFCLLGSWLWHSRLNFQWDVREEMAGFLSSARVVKQGRKMWCPFVFVLCIHLCLWVIGNVSSLRRNCVRKTQACVWWLLPTL